MLTEIPLLAIVPDALVPANAAVACTKSLPRFDTIAVVSALCEAVTTELLFMPKLMPLALSNSTVPVVAAVWVPAAMILTPSAAPPPGATLKLSWKPLVLFVIDPEIFAPLKVVFVLLKYSVTEGTDGTV